MERGKVANNRGRLMVVSSIVVVVAAAAALVYRQKQAPPKVHMRVSYTPTPQRFRDDMPQDVVEFPTLDNLSTEIEGRGNLCTDAIWYVGVCEGLKHLDAPSACIISGDPTRPRTAQGTAAHTLEVWGLDGVVYCVADQGFGNLYQKPADTAGSAAIKVWQDCMDSVAAWGRGEIILACNGYRGTAKTPPGGRQNPARKLLSQMPQSTLRDYYLGYYACAGFKTPTAAPVPPSPLVSATRTKTTVPSPAPCCDPDKIPCPVGAVLCHKSPTRAPSTTRYPSVTRTAPRTATAAPATTTPSPIPSHTVTARASSTRTLTVLVPSPSRTPTPIAIGIFACRKKP